MSYEQMDLLIEYCLLNEMIIAGDGLGSTYDRLDAIWDRLDADPRAYLVLRYGKRFFGRPAPDKSDAAG